MYSHLLQPHLNGGADTLYDLTYSSPSELNLSHLPNNQLKNVQYPRHLAIIGLGKMCNYPAIDYFSCFHIEILSIL